MVKHNARIFVSTNQTTQIMTTFKSESQATNKAAEIAKTTNVYYTNEGFEIIFTSDDTNQKEVAEALRSVFSDVKVVGRKVPSIRVNRISLTSVNAHITQVTY